MNYCIAGIHTGIGKTVCSAVLCEALGYDYWKPVQAGDLDQSDSIFIRDHISNANTYIHPERYKLSVAASPHYAAEVDGITIRKEDFILPKSDNSLIIETAGGLMSPLSSELLNIDLVQYLACPVILVSNNYLGSINHTLLSVELLKQRNIKVEGIVFVGDTNMASEQYILEYTKLKHLFSIPTFTPLDKQSIREFVINNNISLNHE